MNNRSIKSIDRLEMYVEQLTGMQIVHNDLNEIIAIDALGAGLADFNSEQQEAMIDIARRVLDCESTPDLAGNSDLSEEISESFWHIVESVL